MKRLKIGYFIDTFFPMIDGVVMVVDNYARKLSEFADVTVFAPRVEKDYIDAFPYDVVRAASARIPFFDYTIPNPEIDIEFHLALESAGLDIVHIHSPFFVGRMGIRYAQKNKIPLFATMHSQYKQDVQRYVKNELVTDVLTDIIVNVFERCDKCFAVNDEVGRIFHEDYGYSKMPDVIGNATDMVLCDKDKASRTVREKYGVLPDEKILIFVGRINKLKNVMFICDTLYEMKKRGEKFKMLFVGKGEDEETVKASVDEKKLEKNVVFCGRITERNFLEQIYAAADLFLFPSLYDASSLVQIEAASQKLPVAFLEGAATAATVTNNVNGIVAPKEKYVDEVIDFLHDEKRRKMISDGAFRDLYVTWDDVAKQVYSQYLSVLKKD